LEYRIDLRVPPFIDKEFIGVIANSIDRTLNILGETLVAHLGVMDFPLVEQILERFAQQGPATLHLVIEFIELVQCDLGI
jgi:hypothetical protein